MLLTAAHILLYALIQTFLVSLYTLALKRLGRLKRVYRLKAFAFLLLVNLAGTMTFGEHAWRETTTPIFAGLFLLGMTFFLAAHLCLALRRKK